MSQFRRSALLWMLLGWMTALAANGFAQTSAPASEKMKTVAYTIPKGLFGKTDPADPTGEPRARAGVKRLEGDASPYLAANVYDVREAVESLGLSFPPGSEAIYLADQTTLLLRNTPENLDLARILFESHTHESSPHAAQTDLAVVALVLPAGLLDLGPLLSYSQLRQAAGDSWTVLDTIQLISKSGLRASASSTTGRPAQKTESPSENPSSASLPPGALGGSVILDNIIDQDGMFIDVNLSFLHRSVRGNEKTPFELEYNGSVTLRDQFPQVLQISAASENAKAGASVPAYALIIRSSLVTASTKPFADPETTQAQKK